MKNKERIIWISIITILIVISTLGVFVNKANAGTIHSSYPYLQKFLTAMDYVKKNYVDKDSLNNDKLIDGAIKGMIDALGDPYSIYLTKSDLKEFNTETKGKFGGVGMIIAEKDHYIVVVSPIEGTPAYRKGLKAGDLLINVDGKSLRDVSVSDAANLLRGDPGTIVKVGVIRDDADFEVEITRAIIDVPTVKHTMINDRYGYLRITQFSGTTDKYVKDALIDLVKKNNAKAIIVDLRSNPGGLLYQVINIVDFFQDNGVIVSTKGRSVFDSEVDKASKINTIVSKDIPVIVLVDGGSASAAEIFSGAIKDNNRGILIGAKTFGKGSVQTIHQLGKDGIKLTIAKYYTPSGVCIHGIGIEPNIEVKEPELTDDQKESLRKIYKDKVIEKLIKANKTPSSKEIDAMVNKLQNDGYNLPKRYLKKMIKNEVETGNNTKTIIDLDFDIQLQEAVKVLDNNLLIYKDEKYYLKKSNKE